jgi:homoserine O-acetyltransferase
MPRLLLSLPRVLKQEVDGLTWLAFVTVCLLAPAAHAAEYPVPVEADYVLRDFAFAAGDVLPALNMHYFTLGTPLRDAEGRVTNAVLMLHGTAGSGAGFLGERFAGELFGAGQPLDTSRWYIVVPDSIGHGRSSKPSDGLRARFPRYGYADMVKAQYRLLEEGLGVDHLKLIVGISMGGMHAWMWAEEHPQFMDAVLPVACLPTQIAGRNRMERRLIVEAIRNDPQWNAGNYASQPQGLLTALRIVAISSGSTKNFYREAPTQEATDRLLDRMVQQRMQSADANDVLYAWDASRDYDPAAQLPSIRAALTAVNFADDERNPAHLGIMESNMQRVPRGKYVLIPASERTRGHASAADAALWKEQLTELLERSAR